MSVGGFDWLSEVFDVGYCLTFGRGLDPVELLERMGGDPRRAAERTAAETELMNLSAEYGYGPMVRVGRAGEWAFAVEEVASWEGTRPEVLRRVSAGTQAACLFRNESALAYVGVAENGEVIARFDPLFPDRATGVDPARLWPAMRRVGLDPEGHDRPDDPYAAGLALVAEEFGVSLGPEDVDRPLLSARLVPVLDELSWIEPRVGLRREPRLAVTVAHTPEDRLRPVVVDQARKLAVSLQLTRRPEVAQALDAAAAGRAVAADDDSPLGWLARRAGLKVYEAQRAQQDPDNELSAQVLRQRRRRQGALRALCALASQPPAQAATWVFDARSDFTARWRDEVLEALADVAVPEDEVRAAEEEWRQVQAQWAAIQAASWRPPE